MDKEDSEIEGEDGNSLDKRALSHRILKPGESFANYRVVKCIASGLLVNYYHMQHIRELHEVTVGIFHPRTGSDPKFLHRVQNLQAKLQFCDHEGIPQIREIKEEGGFHFIFLDWVEGNTLSQHLGTFGKPGERGLALDETARIIAQLHGILGFAHAKGLRHLDLNTDLILMSSEGSLRILGVGIKTLIGKELFESVISASVSPLASKDMVGRLNSFDIMSPEYRAGHAEDQRVDVYAIGLIGYWLLTGRKADPAELQPASSFLSGLPARWDTFFSRSLDRRSDARYQSCKLALLGLKKVNERESDAANVSYIQRQIDRMPVPRGIVDRGGLATRIYRLTLIGLIGVTLTGVMASYFQSLFTESVNVAKPMARVVEAGEAPDLRIRVEPPKARLLFAESGEEFSTNNGFIHLKVAAGRHRLLFTAENHVRKEITIDVEPGSQLEIEQSLSLASREVRVQSETEAEVRMLDASGAWIELGLTDAEGVFLLDEALLAVARQMEVRKKGYASFVVEGAAIDFGEEGVLEARLEVLMSRVQVRTEPPGASLSVAGELIGISPLTLRLSAEQHSVTIRAELEGYRSLERSLDLTPGASVNMDFGVMAPLVGELDLSVGFAGAKSEEVESLREAVRVYFEERALALNDSALEKIPPGRHSLRIKHPDYFEEAIVVEIQDGVTNPQKVELRPRPASVLLELPDGLQGRVRIDGREVPVEEGRVSVPANVSIQFELSVPDFLTMSRNVELKPNETLKWTPELESIPGPEAGLKWTVPYVGAEFVWIGAGRFTMGSPHSEPGRLPNEGPSTQISFTRGFWIGAYEVTQGEYLFLMGENPSEFRGSRLPVDSVTFEEARRYAARLTKQEREAGRLPEGYSYRLPSEAEWEYAARAGTETPYSFGAYGDASFGNFRGIYPPGSEGRGPRVPEGYGTFPVGSYPPNAFGLYDVHGNVKEWTLDAYNGRLPGGELTDPKPRTEGRRITLRGGSWADFAVQVRSASRDESQPSTRSHSLGFRVVLAPEIPGQ